MIATDPVVLQVGERQLILRFTVPRLRELNIRTGKTTIVLFSELAGLSFDAMIWLLWAAVAHKDNPDFKGATDQQIAVLLDPLEDISFVGRDGDTPLKAGRGANALVNALTAAFQVAFPPPDPNPPNPTLQ